MVYVCKVQRSTYIEVVFTGELDHGTEVEWCELCLHQQGVDTRLDVLINKVKLFSLQDFNNQN